MDRYSRQILFPRIGRAGQEKIRAATVGILGLGALGSVSAEMLTRAGVRRIVAVDRDIIEASNLHRQGLYAAKDAEEHLPKATAAARRLRELNPDVVVESHIADFGPENALELFGECDLILDGTDSFETRYLLNDTAIVLGVPWIYAACVASGGMGMTIIPGETPCLACLFPDPPDAGSAETCDTAGIIAPAAAVAGAFQVAEALKLLVGDRSNERRTLISFDLWPFRIVEIGRGESLPRADCRACGTKEQLWLKGERTSRTVKLCGRNSVQVYPGRSAGHIDLQQLASRLAGLGELRVNEFVLLLEVQNIQVSIFADGRALIKGTTDPVEARRIYTQFVGL